MADSGLALVCANIGGLQADDDGNERYVKSPDCLESLRDLQRYLRRDHPETRNVFLELGKWNVVRQDLVPLLKRYSDDFEIVLNCVKILVFLTMPVEPTSHQVSKQVEYLQHFKAAVVEGDAIAVIVSHLEEPLQNLESGCPKDDDWKLFQLFLTLVRNFLSIPDCLPQHGPSSPQISNLRDQMLERLFNENAMELVVVLTQHVAGHGGLRHDNLLILEIIQQAFWGQEADQVAAVAPSDVKVAKQCEKSAATLRAVLQSEREQLKRLRKGSSSFTGMFVQVARDGSKTMLTRNPHQSPLENLIRKPQVKRGVIKRIVQDPHPVFQSSDQIYVLLKDFADQFLTSGYNILMQSVKEDIQRERKGLETPDIVAFFQVAQFFTSYQCYVTQRAQKHQVKSNDGSSDGAEKEPAAQKHLCGLIASTMDEPMFKMVLSKWQEFSDFAEEAKDWKPLAAAVAVMKDMIRMLDLVLKRSGSLTREGQQELRTARILLYQVFYNYTETGILHFLNSLIRSFDLYKQPRSHLADLVEITHIVLRILDSFAKSGESIRVLAKVRGGWKRKPKQSEQPQTEGAEQNPTEDKADKNGPESDADISRSPKHTSVSSPNANLEPERLAEEGFVPNVEEGEEHAEDQSEVELQKKCPAGSPEEDEENETFHTSPVDAATAADDEGDDSDGERQNRTKEKTLNVREVVDKFANNVVVRNYCWLLNFHSTNRPAINHYVVRMLQRICDDYHLEPMLYQISILQTFYSVLSNRQLQGAEDHRYVISFLSKVVRRLFKKLEAHPILFVDILFWKTRAECHHITADYMIHSLRKDTGGSSQNRKKINIADALGDDEEDVPTNRDTDDEESALSSEDEDAALIPFTEDQAVQIKELFERFKDDEQYAQLIATELDPFEKYTAAQVKRKLRSLGLKRRSANRSKQKDESEGDKCKKGQSSLGSQSPDRNQKSRRASDGSGPIKKSNLFSEAQDQTLRELFEKHGSGKNVTKVITENLGGEFTTAQVSRRLRRLGLVKPKPRTARSSLHCSLTDSEQDDDDLPRKVTDSSSPEKGNKRLERSGGKSASRRRINTEDLSNSHDEEDAPGSGFSKPSSRQERPASTARQGERRLRKRRIESVELVDSDDDDAPIARLVRSAPAPALAPGQDEEDAFANELTGPSSRQERPASTAKQEEMRSRKRRIESVELIDSDDDDAPLARLVRSAPAPAQGQDGTLGGYPMGEEHKRKRTNTVDLEDSDDDAPLTQLGRSAPAPGQDGTTGGGPMREEHPRRRTNKNDLEDSDDDAPISSGAIRTARSKEGAADPTYHTQEKHPQRRRVKPLNSGGSEDDFPSRGLIKPAYMGDTVAFEDSEDDDVLMNILSSGSGGTSVLDHTGEKITFRSDDTEDLGDNEEDLPSSRLTTSEPSQAGTTVLKQTGETNSLNDNFEDLEDSEDDVNDSGAEALLGSAAERHSRTRKRVNTIDLSESEDEGLQ
ncbi:unnamed protein product [Calypogeia fissa]